MNNELFQYRLKDAKEKLEAAIILLEENIWFIKGGKNDYSTSRMERA